MDAAKAWGLLPSQWVHLDRSDRALIIAHQQNQTQRCPGCAAPLGAKPEDLEQVATVDFDCPVCKARHRIDEADKKRRVKRPTWVHRFFVPKFREPEEED